MLTKRRFVISAFAATASPLAINIRARAASASEQLIEGLVRIERESGGRLGVAVRDIGSKAQ